MPATSPAQARECSQECSYRGILGFLLSGQPIQTYEMLNSIRRFRDLTRGSPAPDRESYLLESGAEGS